MSEENRDFPSMSLEELVEKIAESGKPIAQAMAKAELLRRQAASQLEANAAQVVAAQSARQPALYAQKSARWALASVIVVAITSLLTFAASIAAWLFPHVPR